MLDKEELQKAMQTEDGEAVFKAGYASGWVSATEFVAGIIEGLSKTANTPTGETTVEKKQIALNAMDSIEMALRNVIEEQGGVPPWMCDETQRMEQ